MKKKYLSIIGICSFLLVFVSVTHAEPIDRESLVKRHRISTTGTLLMSPAQVGNGKFAFGMAAFS